MNICIWLIYNYLLNGFGGLLLAFVYACALLLLADGKQTCPAHFILEWAGQEGRIGISCELLPLVPNDASLICQLKL